MSEVVAYADEMRALLAKSSLVERRAFINSFVKEIEATGRDAILSYTLPLPPDTAVGTDGSRGTSGQEEVLAIVASGTPSLTEDRTFEWVVAL